MPNPLAGLSGLGAKLPALAEKLTGPPALHQAAASGDLTAVRRLTQKQYDIDQQDQRFGQTPLHIAAAKSHDLIVAELLDRRAATSLQDKEGRTPLLIASEAGDLKVVQLLLGPRNKDPARATALTARNTHGFTPLLAAAAAGHAAVVQALLAAGAYLGDTLENRVSAGHLAARGGHLEALAVLVAAGLNIRADTHDRRTLLHEAATNGHARVIAWLLQSGVDPNIRDLRQQATALELAIQNGCYAAVMALKDATAAPIAGPLAPPGAPAAPPVPAAPAVQYSAGGGGVPVVSSGGGGGGGSAHSASGGGTQFASGGGAPGGGVSSGGGGASVLSAGGGGFLGLGPPPREGSAGSHIALV